MEALLEFYEYYIKLKGSSQSSSMLSLHLRDMLNMFQNAVCLLESKKELFAISYVQPGQSPASYQWVSSFDPVHFQQCQPYNSLTLILRDIWNYILSYLHHPIT
jgi:hypothetical protein